MTIKVWEGSLKSLGGGIRYLGGGLKPMRVFRRLYKIDRGRWSEILRTAVLEKRCFRVSQNQNVQ